MKRSTCFLGWKGGRYSFKRNLAIVDWFSGQLAGPMLPLGRLKTHLMFFASESSTMKKRNHEIYLTWVTGRDQSILQQLYAVMFFCWFATDFTKFVHQWWIIISFQRSMFLFLSKEFNIFNFATTFDSTVDSKSKFWPTSLRFLDVFGWKKWCRPRGVPRVSWVRVFTGNAGKATPWKLRTKKTLQRVMGCLRRQGGSRIKT